MKRRSSRTQIFKALLFMAMFFSECWAGEGVSVASGFGAAQIVPLRFGFQTEFEKRWRSEAEWPIGGYWEGSVYGMRGQRGTAPGSHRSLEAVALAGVVRFERAKEIVIGWPYIELGLGLSWLSQKEIGGRDLGMHYQFEDRFGVGVRFGANREYDIGYKAIHFSNAYIGPSNHGINLHVLSLGYWFN
jgi:lipid A 3-O-deacylase